MFIYIYRLYKSVCYLIEVYSINNVILLISPGHSASQLSLPPSCCHVETFQRQSVFPTIPKQSHRVINSHKSLASGTQGAFKKANELKVVLTNVGYIDWVESVQYGGVFWDLEVM